MTATYCGTADVKRILGLGYNFSSSTNPSETEVEILINTGEDWVENKTRRAWREKTITNEYYDIPQEKYYNWSTGIPIFLKRRFIKTLNSVSGDKIEVWNGSDYEDFLTTKTEGRDEDFWIDYTKGILYLRVPFKYYRTKALRITYRYGETTVPTSIRDATALFVASKIISSDERSFTLPEAGDGTRMPIDIRYNRWQKMANDLLEPYKEYFSYSF